MADIVILSKPKMTSLRIKETTKERIKFLTKNKETYDETLVRILDDYIYLTRKLMGDEK